MLPIYCMTPGSSMFPVFRAVALEVLTLRSVVRWGYGLPMGPPTNNIVQSDSDDPT